MIKSPDNGGSGGFDYKEMLNKKYSKKQAEDEDSCGELVLPGLSKNNRTGGHSPIMGSKLSQN